MGQPGFEPGTDGLWVRCSNRWAIAPWACSITRGDSKRKSNLLACKKARGAVIRQFCTYGTWTCESGFLGRLSCYRQHFAGSKCISRTTMAIALSQGQEQIIFRRRMWLICATTIWQATFRRLLIWATMSSRCALLQGRGQYLSLICQIMSCSQSVFYLLSMIFPMCNVSSGSVVP